MNRNGRGISTLVGLVVIALGLTITGCPPIDVAGVQDLLAQATQAVNQTIDNIQEGDFEAPQGVVDEEGNVLDSDVGGGEFVGDLDEDLAGVDITGIVLLAIENMTSYHIWIGGLINGQEVSAWIDYGHTLLLEYDCDEFESIVLLVEEDYGEVGGQIVWVQEFTWPDGRFSWFLDDDYYCGDLFVITITDEEIEANPELVDLY